MPNHNHFRHQTYGTVPSPERVEYLTAEKPPEPDSPEWSRRMAAVGAALRQHNVAAIYLMHGTFVGDDLLGLVRTLERVWASLGGDLRRYERRLANWLVGDSGNYTVEFADQFERQINVTPEGRPLPTELRIPVRLLPWTSENHHLGRADGAVRLLNELAGLKLVAGRRLLLWGHSHGGNVFALLTNLIGATAEMREQFFQAASSYFTSVLIPPHLRSPWERARELLRTGENPFADVALDLTTFGTPVRYGWDSAGYDRLLHFIYHRPIDGLPPYQARFPFSLLSAREGKRGDYVQQIGIAGTNLLPPLINWAARRADAELNRLLQPDLLARDLYQRLGAGQRVPDEGLTLLINYQAAGRMLAAAMGHAIYTRQSWLLYHAEQVAARWYGLKVDRPETSLPT